MQRLSARLIGVFWVLIGVRLIPMTLGAETGTLQLCRAYEPDFLQIDLSRARLSGVDVRTMTVSWFDGCNLHGSPFLPLLFALFLIIGGSLLIGSPTIRSKL